MKRLIVEDVSEDWDRAGSAKRKLGGLRAILRRENIFIEAFD